MSKLDFHKAFDVQKSVDCGPTVYTDVLSLSWCVIITIKNYNHATRHEFYTFKR